jgi:hypothetical protein
LHEEYGNCLGPEFLSFNGIYLAAKLNELNMIQVEGNGIKYPLKQLLASVIMPISISVINNHVNQYDPNAGRKILRVLSFVDETICKLTESYRYTWP